jgi:hypothetical protein
MCSHVYWLVEGQRTLDVGRRSEITAAPNVRALNQAVRIGSVGGSRSYEEKDQLQLRECRIIYKRRSAGTRAQSSEFAAVASLSPQLYVDPNATLRRRAALSTIANASTNKNAAPGALPQQPPPADAGHVVAHTIN